MSSEGLARAKAAARAARVRDRLARAKAAMHASRPSNRLAKVKATARASLDTKRARMAQKRGKKAAVRRPDQLPVDRDGDGLVHDGTRDEAPVQAHAPRKSQAKAKKNRGTATADHSKAASHNGSRKGKGNPSAAGNSGQSQPRQKKDHKASSAENAAGRAAQKSRSISAKTPAIPATHELADEIADVGLPRSRQTVVLIETREGRTIAAAGGPDLTKAQRDLAQKRGLHIADDLPNFHGELTGMATAGWQGFLPTRGVTTNKMCDDGPESCYAQLSEMAQKGGYRLWLSPDRKSFRFIKRRRIQGWQSR